MSTSNPNANFQGQSEKTRHLLITFFFLIAILNGLIFFLIGTLGNDLLEVRLLDSSLQSAYFTVFNGLFVISSLAIFWWKKWGIYAIAILGVVCGISFFYKTENTPAFFYNIQIGMLSIAFLYVWRHKEQF